MSIVVLISGSGTNLQALIDAKLPISHVVSSDPAAYGIERAKRADIATIVHSLKKYYGDVPVSAKDERKRIRAKFNEDLARLVIELQPSLVVCAGWMLILSPKFLEPLAAKNIDIINLHPALPGAFPGIHAIERAWEAGQRGEITKGGLMIHYVIAAVDEGEPLIVREIDLRKDETVEKYEERVHSVEHEAIVDGARLALKKIAERDAKSTTSPKKPDTDGNATRPGSGSSSSANDTPDDAATNLEGLSLAETKELKK